MADTRVQLQVEDWVRKEWMPKHFGQKFSRERVNLTPGGIFDFDAVSDDETIVATISTSGATTSSGKNAVGKLLKIRSDMFFLLLVNAKRRLVLLTELDMFELCNKEKKGGRVPPEIEFIHVTIPKELNSRLKAARETASNEIGPKQRK